MEIIHVKCIGKRHYGTSQVTNKPELDFFKLVLHRQKIISLIQIRMLVFQNKEKTHLRISNLKNVKYEQTLKKRFYQKFSEKLKTCK